MGTVGDESVRYGQVGNDAEEGGVAPDEQDQSEGAQSGAQVEGPHGGRDHGEAVVGYRRH